MRPQPIKALAQQADTPHKAQTQTAYDMDVIIYEDIKDDSSFLQLAKSIGKIRRHKNGQDIKFLTVSEKSAARPNTLSSLHGKGAFPLHTDTAFCSTPVKYVLLRAISGDLSRPTTFISFNELLGDIPESLIQRAVWSCTYGSSLFYTQIRFKVGDAHGQRLDLDCMQPCNKSAMAIRAHISSRLTHPKEIKWKPNMVAVIPNWTHLHGRGDSKKADTNRILQRIYVD